MPHVGSDLTDLLGPMVDERFIAAHDAHLAPPDDGPRLCVGCGVDVDQARDALRAECESTTDRDVARCVSCCATSDAPCGECEAAVAWEAAS